MTLMIRYFFCLLFKFKFLLILSFDVSNNFSDASTISFIEKILIIIQLQVYLFNKECLEKKMLIDSSFKS